MTQRASDNQFFNLEKARILLLDGDTMSVAILTQILAGFGAKNLIKCTAVDAAKAHALKGEIELFLIDPSVEGGSGYKFVSWLRRTCPPPNRFSSILAVSGHTPVSTVKQVRDMGYNFLVAKPLTPTGLYQRIMWVARERRPYVQNKFYAGPDRRFKFEGLPPGSDGRRESDLPADLGDPSAPNMSQEDIDAMVQPLRISI
jgi:DNA-binding response OmpR family regulator